MTITKEDCEEMHNCRQLKTIPKDENLLNTIIIAVHSTMRTIREEQLENAFVDIAIRSHDEKNLSPKERLDRFWVEA